MYAEPVVLEGLHHGATTMLAYFHYKNKGDLPFSLDNNKTDWVDLGHMDTDQVRFIKYAFEEIKRRSMPQPHTSFVKKEVINTDVPRTRSRIS